VGLLAQLMRRAVIEDRIGKTPCVEADQPPVPPKSQLVLDRFQLEDLAEAIGTRVPRHRALVYTLGYAGLRIGEASALIRDRIDLGRCEIHVLQSRKRDGSVGDTKTHQRRTVVIPPALRDRLASISTPSSNLGSTRSCSPPQGGPTRAGHMPAPG
jgi:integrase